jgi:hypothetical protein
MPPEAMSAEVMQEFGQALRIVIEGLMEVLRARGEIRNEFRLPQTSFKPRDNNPLKLAVNAEDAIHNLLVKRNPAYLGTTAAFTTRSRMCAITSSRCSRACRAAYEFMLQRFNPQALKTQFDSKPGRKGGLGFGGQGRYWDAFEEYRDVTADPSDCFRRLFGDQFARAYEEQIQRLRSTRQSKRVAMRFDSDQRAADRNACDRLCLGNGGLCEGTCDSAASAAGQCHHRRRRCSRCESRCNGARISGHGACLRAE